MEVLHSRFGADDAETAVETSRTNLLGQANRRVSQDNKIQWKSKNSIRIPLIKALNFLKFDPKKKFKDFEKNSKVYSASLLNSVENNYKREFLPEMKCVNFSFFLYRLNRALFLSAI